MFFVMVEISGALFCAAQICAFFPLGLILGEALRLDSGGDQPGEEPGRLWSVLGLRDGGGGGVLVRGPGCVG